jgi:uncharacterized protein (TIGR02246 family)
MTAAVPPDGTVVETLYFTLLARWNAQDAAGMAALFVPEGVMIGFDGSEAIGAAAIQSSLGAIFEHHRTPSFVAKIRAVRLLGGAALVNAVAGMIPPGHDQINPDLNAIQSLVASNAHGTWRVELFQNTPAAFHGRPEARDQLTAELRELMENAR